MAGPLRCLIDSMVFDELAGERELLVTVDRLTRARRLELLAAAETMVELAATADPDHRRDLQRVRVLVLPPVDTGQPRLRALHARLFAARGVSDEDARIALSASEHDVPLVTEDRDLRVAVATELPRLELWTVADLRREVDSLSVSG